jgi:hypothetical protein
VVVYAATNIYLSTERGSRYHPTLSLCAPQTTCTAEGGREGESQTSHKRARLSDKAEDEEEGNRAR